MTICPGFQHGFYKNILLATYTLAETTFLLEVATRFGKPSRADQLDKTIFAFSSFSGYIKSKYSIRVSSYLSIKRQERQSQESSYLNNA